MHRILILAVVTALLAAAEVAIPLSVFDQAVEQPTVDGKLATVADGRISLVADAASTVAWTANGAEHSVTVFVVDRSSSNHAPAWAADATTGFAGGRSLQMARQRASMEARTAMVRKASGQQEGQVEGVVTGSVMELVITIAADAADQPVYTVPDGRMMLSRKHAAEGTPGEPWVRCWARSPGAKVEVTKP